MRRTVVLLAAAAVALAPAAALGAGPQPALASGAQPAAGPEPEADQDSCAAVEGQVPLMCQTGAGQQAPQPARLPRTGPSSSVGGAVLLLLAGGGVLLARRLVPPQPEVD